MSSSVSSPVIRLKGVRQNNLKNFDLDLPLRQLTVVTGLSGSGKSSLAFDTLFAEGQRRYIETFSPYARQFFDRMDKPAVDRIEGIPPAIAVEQKNSVRTTRSTVGTMTELCEYLKVAWPRLSKLTCPKCERPVQKETPALVWKECLENSKGMSGSLEVLITFDLPLGESLSIKECLGLIESQGYQRLLVEGEVCRMDSLGDRFGSRRPAFLTVVQDRLKVTSEVRSRFTEACEQAYHFGKGRLTVWRLESASTGTNTSASSPRVSKEQRYSNRFHCASCDRDFREPTPALFSFNHPLGACPKCRGFGRVIGIDYDLVIPDRKKTLAGGLVRPWQSGVSADCQKDLARACRKLGVPMDVPFDQLSPEHQEWVLQGEPDYGKDEEHEWPRAWYGVKGYFRWLESKAYKMHVRVLLSRYRSYTDCPDCQGARFQPDSLLYKVDWPAELAVPPRLSTKPLTAGRLAIHLSDFYKLPIRTALEWVKHCIRNQSLDKKDPLALALGEIRARLSYLDQVGLGYLTLDRPTRTLSGGETERVNLTTCLGTRLVNTLFVLDEPSVGLHPRDTERLVGILESLRNAGNTVVVVEHEARVMRAADQIVDLGPGQGEQGGQVVFQGSFREILESSHSLTGQYLSGVRESVVKRGRPVELAASQRSTPSAVRWLRVVGANAQNLKQLTVEFPLNRFVCLTGVSGSGKSTFLRDVLLPGLKAKIADSTSGAPAEPLDTGDGAEDSESDESEGQTPRAYTALEGVEHLDRVVLVDQSSLGKTPRSNPVVYVGAFEHIRNLYSELEIAKQRGLSASAFSFNSSQGQCERCRGAGFEKIEMQFLSDVFIRCPDCAGRRYREHILEVKLSATPVHAERSVVYEDPGTVVRGEVHPRWQMQDALPATIRRPSPTRKKSKTVVTGDPWSWSIADMLEATIDDAVAFLKGLPGNRHAMRALRSLQWLQEVGLGYLRLGQPINTLSGGESQRLKLVSYLAESEAAMALGGTAGLGAVVDAPRTLFLFDEPTTGLHFEDVRVLLEVFQKLVDAGHSMLVIEHNLDVIRSADWVVDLGPEAGDEGGTIVVVGTPETVQRCSKSHTGKALAEAQAHRNSRKMEAYED